jgi:superfamily II DNA/RNA helicase
MTTFAAFGLHPHLNTAIAAGGYTTPTPVQLQAIPAVMAGRDVMASAQTGTGKTGAFVIPALQKLLTTPVPARGHGPRVLVLTPTRELAQQVMDSAKLFGKTAGMRTGVIVGGVGYGPQYNLLINPLDVLVATPGRLIDHQQQRKIDWSRIEMVVLDEADRMLDMGFLKPVQTILAALPRAPQTLLFTATLTQSVEKFAVSVLKNPLRITLAPTRPSHELITQRVLRADSQEHKFTLLNELLKQPDMAQAIIFAATKHGSDKLATRLAQAGYASAALHGGMKQNARKRTLDQLHHGRLKLLVATDVAARGLDVKELGHVINYDLPQVAEDYVHRIGRTGRSGSKGIAISLVAPSDVPMLRDIEKLLGKPMILGLLEGFEPELTEIEFARLGAAAPRSRQTSRGRSGNGARTGSHSGPNSRPKNRPAGTGFGASRGSSSGGRSHSNSEGGYQKRPQTRRSRPS